MIFKQHYSSSSGNLYEVQSLSGRSLLIDCGVRWREIQIAVKYQMDKIVGCLISHAHLDHARSAKNLLAAGIDVYASEATLEFLNLFKERRAFTLEATRTELIAPFYVFPFDVHHDIRGALGFIITDNWSGEKLLFATDTSHIKYKWDTPFNIIAIECSYDKKIVKRLVDSNKLNREIAERLQNSHMEKSVTLKYLTDCCNLDKNPDIHLLHCSSTCLIKTQTIKEFEDELTLNIKVSKSGQNQRNQGGEP